MEKINKGLIALLIKDYNIKMTMEIESLNTLQIAYLISYTELLKNKLLEIFKKGLKEIEHG